MSTIGGNRARTIVLAVALALFGLQASVLAGTKVAVINDSIEPFPGASWCSLLTNNGYECTLFPATGPTPPLDAFAVVIDLSGQWTDPQHTLADFLQTGKGVITWGGAPYALGVDNDPVVQSWIGANNSTAGTGAIVTTATDSILGDRPQGTMLGGAGDCCATAVDDIVGHPDAKVLARFNSGTGNIALLRNRWEGGRSIYFSDAVFHDDIILRAMNELSTQIPATSTWSLVIFCLGILVFGTVIGRSRI